MIFPFIILKYDICQFHYPNLRKSSFKQINLGNEQKKKKVNVHMNTSEICNMYVKETSAAVCSVWGSA